MGLDMYLSANLYLSGWDHARQDERSTYNEALRIAGLSRGDIDEGAPAGYLKLNIGYWRKANAIHRWFVKNVQGGCDECQHSGVSREQLEALRDACKTVLAAIRVVDGNVYAGTVITKDGAERKYRPGGVADYDEGYVQDLEDTIRIVDRALGPKFDGWSFEYHASW